MLQPGSVDFGIVPLANPEGGVLAQWGGGWRNCHWGNCFNCHQCFNCHHCSNCHQCWSCWGRG